MKSKLEAVADVLGVEIGVITHPTRGKAACALVRAKACYLLCCALGLSMTEAGALVGRDRTTVRQACARIEDLRDSADIDEEMQRAEDALRGTVTNG